MFLFTTTQYRFKDTMVIPGPSQDALIQGFAEERVAYALFNRAHCVVIENV
jgi:hypothetical protein